MTGYQITFYTYYGRAYKHHSIPEWLMELAEELKLPGTTISSGLMGISHQGQVHSKTWLDDSDEPVQVVFIVTPEQEKQLFDRLNSEEVNVFYTRSEVEFGYSGRGPI